MLVIEMVLPKPGGRDGSTQTRNEIGNDTVNLSGAETRDL